MSRSAEFESKPAASGAEPFGLRPLSSIAATGAGGVPQGRILQLLADLIEPLATLHAWGRVHGGIATDTIGRGESGPAQLLDPAGEPVPNGEETVRRPGFAAFEQYTDDPRSPCGPWTDIYALSALAHSLVTGAPPADALARRVHDDYVPLAQRTPQGYDPAFLAGVDAGLSMNPSARPQSLEAYAALLALPVDVDPPGAPALVDAAANDEGDPVEEAVGGAAAAAPRNIPREEPRRVSGMMIAAVMAILAVAAFLWLDSDEPPPRVARTAPAAAPSQPLVPGAPTRNEADSTGNAAVSAADRAGAPPAPAGQADGKQTPAGQTAAAGTAASSPLAGFAAGAAPGPVAGAAPSAVAAGGQGQPAAKAAVPVGGAADLPDAPRAPESVIATITLGGAAPIPERRTAPGPATVQAPPPVRSNAAPAASKGAAPGARQATAQGAGPAGSRAAAEAVTQPGGATRTAPAPAVAAAAPASPKARGPVAVRVDVRPWGEVFIDGKSRGISPPLRELKLPPGKHSVTVQNAGLPPYRVVLDLTDGRGAAISHVFQ